VKLAISNIAWEPDALDEHLALVSRLGCQAIELAPSCVWPEPISATAKDRKALQDQLEHHHLHTMGLHALLFTRPDLTLFDNAGSRKATGEYLKELFKLCADLGGKILTFGSPRNRSVKGRDYKECLEIAAGFFESLMPSAAANNVVLCLEFLSTKECDFITSSQEAFTLVEKVNSPHFGLHLDIKALIDSGENYREVFKKYASYTQHVHVGDPGLAPPGSTGIDHKPIGEALRDSGYDQYLSIEMRRGFGHSQEVVKQSIQYVKDCYFAGDRK
jgi:sugar phosphate isomerase/epimerase